MKRTSLFQAGLIGFFLIFQSSFNALAKEVPFTLEDRDRLLRIETTLKEFKEAVDKRFEQAERKTRQTPLISNTAYVRRNRQADAPSV